MKHILFALAALCLATAAHAQRTATLIVSNPLAVPRSGEIVELRADTLRQLLAGDNWQVRDAAGRTLTTQLTHDGLLIFQADVPASGTATFSVSATATPKPRKKKAKAQAAAAPAPLDKTLRLHFGKENPADNATAAQPADCRAFGAIYPERDTDLAFENDLVGFRAYGPDKRRKGERLYGYDLWLKRDTTGIVVPTFYATDICPAHWARKREIAKTDRAAAERFNLTYSYHVDHGHGCDPYAVGPTLGAGAAAILHADTLCHQWGWQQAEVLDNGPLRFCARLVYPAFAAGALQGVAEERVLTLDAGTRLCRAQVAYRGLTQPMPVAAGIIRHDNTPFRFDPQHATVAYADPTQGADNGRIFLGLCLPAGFERAADIARHAALITTYTPGQPLLYYFGFAWSRTDIHTPAAWDEYLADRSDRLRHPLQTEIKATPQP